MARIRLARDEDAGAVAAIYAPIVESTAVSFETSPPSGEDMRRRIVGTTVTHPWLVCELDGDVAGYAYATSHRVRAAYRWAVDVSVYTDSRHRRRGVGRGLYASLFEILEAQGFCGAYAGITLPNEASVGLHEAVGFTKVGVYEHVGYKLGTWHDVGWWQRPLKPQVAAPEEPVPLSSLLNGSGWDALVTTGEGFVD